MGSLNDKPNSEGITAIDKETGILGSQADGHPKPVIYEETAHHGDTETKGDLALTQTRTNERPTCFKSTMQELLFIFTVTMANASTSFVAGTNQVITNSIGKDLHASPAEITWIGASASLAAGSFLLFFGRVADLFGRKNLFVSSMGIFSVLALVTGFAPSVIFLDTFNGLMGLMTAAAIPPAAGILGAIYGRPSRRKNYAFACYSAGNPIGFVVGSVASGISTKLFGWRASYWFLALLYSVFTVIAWFTVPKDIDKPTRLDWAAVKRFDLVGAVSTIAGVAMFSSAMTLAGDAKDGWKTPYVLVLLILGTALICFFVYWESIVESPLMPLHIWKDRTFSLLMAILFLGMMSFPPAQFWLSLYMQRVRRLSPLNVAVRLLPQAIMGIMVNVVAGLVMHKVSNKLLMLIGALCYTLSFVLLGILDTGRGNWYWTRVFPSILLTVVGADFEFCVVFGYVASSLPRNMQSMAGGIVQTTTKLSVVVGLGIGTALFEANGPVVGDDPVKPYQATFWLSVAAAGVSVFMVPFLRLRTQGHRERNKDLEEREKTGEPSRDSTDGEVHANEKEKEKVGE